MDDIGRLPVECPVMAQELVGGVIFSLDASGDPDIRRLRRDPRDGDGWDSCGSLLKSFTFEHGMPIITKPSAIFCCLPLAREGLGGPHHRDTLDLVPSWAFQEPPRSPRTPAGKPSWA